MSANCKSCGKLMTKPEDFSGGDASSQYCPNCTNADGSLKSLDEITLHIANQLIISQGIDREAATKAARSILSVQPEWKAPFKRIESKKSLRNKIFIVATCLALVATTVVVYNIFAPNPDRIFYWGDKDDNDKSIFMVTIIDKQNNDGTEISRFELYGDQTMQSIDSFGNVEFIQGNLVFKGKIKDGRFYALTINNNAVSDGNSYAGSISTSKDNVITDDGYLVFDGLHSFWTERADDIYILHTKHSSSIREIGYLKWMSQLVMCGQYAVWIEENGNPRINKVMAYNTDTKKVFQLSATVTSKGDIRSGKTCVYWLDSGDQARTGLTINGYDLVEMKPISTGIQTGTKKYQGKYVKGEMGSIFKNGKTASWSVVGNDVLFEIIDNDLVMGVYDKASGIIKTFSDNGCLPFFTKTVWLSEDSNSQGDSIYLEPGDPMYADNDANVANPFVCWISGIEDDKYSLSCKRINSNEINTYKKLKISKPLGVTGQWFVYLADLDDETERITIKALNLADGKMISLGAYSLVGVRPKEFYNPSFAMRNRHLAWTAKTEDSDNEIFYAKLPEEK